MQQQPHCHCVKVKILFQFVILVSCYTVYQLQARLDTTTRSFCVHFTVLCANNLLPPSIGHRAPFLMATLSWRTTTKCL